MCKLPEILLANFKICVILLGENKSNKRWEKDSKQKRFRFQESVRHGLGARIKQLFAELSLWSGAAELFSRLRRQPPLQGAGVSAPLTQWVV